METDKPGLSTRPSLQLVSWASRTRTVSQWLGNIASTSPEGTWLGAAGAGWASVANDRLLTTYIDTKRYNNGRAYFFYGHLFERLWGAMLGQPPTGTAYEKLVEIELAKAASSRVACTHLS